MAVGYFLYNWTKDPYRTLTTLDPREYMENSNALRGNKYKIRGTVDNASLQWSPTQGRLISVDVDTDDGRTAPLGLLVPPEFNSVNIQKGQKFYFQVEVGDKGILTVKGITKA